MVFSSLLFLFKFLPIVLVLYFVLPKSMRNLALFAVSLFFYAWGEPVYVVLMIFSTVVDYTHGLLVEKAVSTGHKRRAKMIVASSMTINLLLLGFFKYSDFIIANINSLFGTAIPLLNLPLPIGISFYTFQTMSYTIDVYRGQAKAQRNIISFGAYVALFPQLIAGPIVQYKTIAKQLNSREETVDGFSSGVSRFMIGLGKKVLIANNVGIIWDNVKALDISSMPVITAWIGIIAFAFQIYFDFSGYSDMAIGLGRMFGFKFNENFDHPYISQTITEFWRRWHISLGTWFREYVYIPLGGNRRGLPMQIRNILIVWALTGIWHGASWNFLAWGLYFGLILTLEKMFLLKWLQKAPRILRHIYTLVLVLVSWAIFAFDDFAGGISYIGAMFSFKNGFINSQTLYILFTSIVLLAIAAIGSTELPIKTARRLSSAGIGYVIAKNIVFIAIFFLSTAYLVDASYNPFLYFRF